ncbi:MAG: dihydropyrimidinase [Paracoccus sp. (in: a-proteobacteria)]|uniref:dihydropyrimidinase n=1 Tax=unclassified Paracoccus (in: a-proteobacteria) TaxID=2688777 RepID=UPI000C64D35C|nr:MULTISPECIES: dihydropyrimidinase [unclassified Paracoccus (in: a-proteobacteria)]MAN56414.1 dihydropyrimidinase [Paracoccus sp. (in: a-proteobacteria)]MAN57273.1 dihydropyrimidinase [Paracoccus sp. (in: a-proteobacteria)]MBA48879.1 dihydropyrimidinase [Paracoccus sp. (in: a-proteobacteria)]MDB2551492.1 dihydropyrimidinase [Paracoccus sp. (in: a-proteobacteria)]|tara:strand:- start:1144 stop:2595 length:1452 start_codon:yes stop_codon:yes gene_type:complete
MSTVIRNGTIVTADLTYEADVLIEGGRIAAIGQGLTGDTQLDATGCYVMPGGIDPHTHLEMPFMGTYSADDFESGTRAALAGGTTMVVDFALPSPGQGLLDALQMWDNKSGRAHCDYSYHMAVTWWGQQVFDEMAEIVDRGITSFKHFMAYKGALMVNDDELFASFRRVGDLGGIAMVHAENGDVVAELSARLLAEGNTGPEAHAYSRPPQVEGEATNRAIMVADMAGVPLYVVHVSCEDSHEAIRRARQQGKRVWGEPLIQHLTLDESEYFDKDWDHAARRVMSPPFRDKRHQDSLWAGLQSGSLSVVATDHCAFTTEQKRHGVGDFTKIPNGTGGLEDRMPMLWTHGVGTGRLTPNEFVAATSTNSAKILGMYPKKGAVLVGSDADLVVWDPEAEKTISAGSQQSAIDYNVFEGQKVKGLPRYTITRGVVAVTEGKLDSREGHGEFVAREPRGTVNRALSQWKELTAPRPVERTGIPASGV